MSKSGDPRLGDLFKKSLQCNGDGLRKVAILGYPCDEGVRRNSGRVGAKFGPACLRKILPKIGPLVNPEFKIDIQNLHLIDRGNITISDSLEENHVTLTNSVKSILDDGAIGIIVGGGNDQSYCNAKALMQMENAGNIGVVNIDAHLDCRPFLENNLAHSGTPFRQLLEDQQFSGVFYEFAVQGNQSSADHAKFVEDHGGHLTWLSQVNKNGAVTEFSNVLKSFEKRDAFISFDIDAIKGADCPGVSCPGVIGLSAQDALDIAFTAGQHPHTRLLDISEYNPKIEEDRTARLVSNLIYYFLMGVATRSEEGIKIEKEEKME